MRDDLIDAAIVWIRTAQDRDLPGVTLHHAPLHLALPAGHRLAAAAAVRVADVADETVVMVPRELFPGIWDHVMANLLPAGLTRPDQVLTPSNVINAPEALLRAVAADHGVAPVAPVVAAHIAVPGVVVLPLDPPLSAPLELVWHDPPHPALDDLIALLIDTEVLLPSASTATAASGDAGGLVHGGPSGSTAPPHPMSPTRAPGEAAAATRRAAVLSDADTGFRFWTAGAPSAVTTSATPGC